MSRPLFYPTADDMTMTTRIKPCIIVILDGPESAMDIITAMLFTAHVQTEKKRARKETSMMENLMILLTDTNG